MHADVGCGCVVGPNWIVGEGRSTCVKSVQYSASFILGGQPIGYGMETMGTVRFPWGTGWHNDFVKYVSSAGITPDTGSRTHLQSMSVAALLTANTRSRQGGPRKFRHSKSPETRRFNLLAPLVCAQWLVIVPRGNIALSWAGLTLQHALSLQRGHQCVRKLHLPVPPATW